MIKKSFLKKGFTLLELLVVIGIIAVLVAFGTVSYSTAQKKARDAKRQTDLHSFQNAIEQCYSVNNYQYPTITGNGTSTISYTCPATGGPSATITDPTNKTYTVTSSSTAYEVSIQMENSTVPFTIKSQQ